MAKKSKHLYKKRVYVVEDFNRKTEIYLYRYNRDFEFQADKAANFFNKLANREKNKLRSRYAKNLASNIQLKGKKLVNLDQLLVTEDEFDAIAEDIYAAIEECVNQAYEDIGYDSFMSLNKKVRSSITGNIQDLDTILECVSQASTIIAGKENILSILIDNYSQSGNKDLSILRNSLSLLAPKNGEVASISEVALSKIAQYLITIINNYQNIGDINAKTLKSKIHGSLNNIFGESLGEPLQAFALQNIANQLSDANKDIEISIDGKNKANKLPQVTGVYNQTYKTDVAGKNIKISIRGDKDNITADINLSVKTYTGSLRKISIARKKEINTILNSMFSSANYIGKFYTYNTLLFQNKNSSAYQSFKRLMAVRSADNLLSGNDKANFIAINNKWYPIGEIINALINATNVSEIIKIDIKRTNDDLIQHKQDAVKEKPNSYWAFQRSRDINRLLGYFKINAKLNIQNVRPIIIS